MADFYGAHTTPDELIEAVVARLVAQVPNMRADRVIPTTWDDAALLKLPPADFFIALWTPNFPVDQPDVTGGGSINTAFDAVLETRLFRRLEADVETKGPQLLLDRNRGIYRATMAPVLAALQMWEGPTTVDADTSATTSKLRRPLRVAPGMTITGHTVDRSRWAVATIKWEMSFVWNLGVPYP